MFISQETQVLILSAYRLTEATHVVFRSPISSLTLFSLFMRFRTRARLFCESLSASVAVRSTSLAVDWCLQDRETANTM